MSNVTEKEIPARRREEPSKDRRQRRIQNGKTCGHFARHIGSALIMTKMIQPVREKHNSLANACIVGAGAMLSIMCGNAASKQLDKIIDKSVEFFDDINPRKIVEPKSKEENKDG